MLDYNWAIDAYQKLDYSQQKLRLLNLFEIFEQHSVAIQKMLPLLQNDQMKQEDMVQAYTDLSLILESLDKQDIQKVFSKMDQLHAKIQQIQVQEAQDRQNENPENLLKNI